VSAVRVLVVEDDPNVRGLLQTILVAEGYAVVTASDGLDGLGQAAASSPALVLLDLMMPDLGGVRVLERLRDDPVLSQIPVIVITGHEDALPDVRTSLGADNVFLKPFAVAELLARIGAVTGGP
jgi:DNA-binding response OmpR family regulator